jgi:hypothetical protein
VAVQPMPSLRQWYRYILGPVLEKGFPYRYRYFPYCRHAEYTRASRDLRKMRKNNHLHWYHSYARATWSLMNTRVAPSMRNARATGP